MAKTRVMDSSVKLSSEDSGGNSIAINLETRRRNPVRRQEVGYQLRVDAIARLVTVIPPQFTKGKPLRSAFIVARAMIRYIHTANGDPNTALERYQEYIARIGSTDTNKTLSALAELIPGFVVGRGGRLEILRAAYDYALYLQKGEAKAEGIEAIKSEDDASNGDREDRDLHEDEDSDEVEYLATYDISKRARLPELKPQAALGMQFKVEEGHTISQSDKHYISIILGRMKSKSLSEVAVIVERSAPQFVDSFMNGAFPDIGPLPDHVVGEVLTFAKACVPPESLRSMMVTKAGEGSHEDNDAMDIDDPEETTSSRKKRSSTHNARTGSKTSFVVIDELQRDLKSLQAALRASGRDQDDIEEYLSKIARGKKTKTALVEMGWKAA